MNATSRFPHLIRTTLFVAMIVAAAQSLRAQAVFTNPPCTSVAVINTSARCNAYINAVTVPANVWPTFTVGAPGTFMLPVPLFNVQVTGIMTPGGTFVPLNPPQAPGCGVNGWWAANVPLDPNDPLCTVTICFNPSNCTILIW